MPKGDGIADGERKKNEVTRGGDRRIPERGSSKEAQELRTKEVLLGKQVRDALKGQKKGREMHSYCAQAFERITEQTMTYYQNHMDLREVIEQLREHSHVVKGEFRGVMDLVYTNQLAIGENLLAKQKYAEARLQGNLDEAHAQQTRIEVYTLLCKKRLEGNITKETLQRITGVLHREEQAWRDLAHEGQEWKHSEDASKLSAKEEQLREAMRALREAIGEIAPGTSLEALYREIITDRESRPPVTQAFKTFMDTRPDTSQTDYLHAQEQLGGKDIRSVINPTRPEDEKRQFSQLYSQYATLVQERFEHEIQQFSGNPEAASFQAAASTYAIEAHTIEDHFRKTLTTVDEYMQRVESMKSQGKDTHTFTWPGAI